MGIGNTITISFKNTNEDIKLKEWIESHSNKSGFAKDILRNAMEAEQLGNTLQKANALFQKEEVKEIEEDVKLVDLGDF